MHVSASSVRCDMYTEKLFCEQHTQHIRNYRDCNSIMLKGIASHTFHVAACYKGVARTRNDNRGACACNSHYLHLVFPFGIL